MNSCIRRFALAILIVGGAAWPAHAGFFSKNESSSEKENEEGSIVAVYDFDQPLSESGMAPDALMPFSGSPERPLTTVELTLSLRAAALDDKVKAVVLDLDQGGFSMTQLQELHNALEKVRAAGKDVWFYTEYFTNGAAIISSVANHACMMPEGSVMFNGIASQGMYFKTLLEKVGVLPQVIHIGGFKSAGEPFTRTGPSEKDQQQRGILLDGMYRQILTTVADGRDQDVGDVEKIIDTPFMTAAELKASGLIDRTLYRAQFIAAVREAYPDAVIDKNYQLPERGGPEIDGFMDLLKAVLASDPDALPQQDHIAIVTMDGAITDQSVAPVRSQIIRAANNPNAKALVFRVNSPGGSAQSSDVLWQATNLWKATGKPFVVSMGGVAASGGYYISAGADRIFAEAGTITGSIGVIGMVFHISELMDKMGIHVHTDIRGRSADITNPMRAMTPSEIDAVQKSMTGIYQTFKERVAEGRGEKLGEDVENLAGGRVYTGTDARQLGLVDEIGGVSDAVFEAARLAKLEPMASGVPRIALYPKPISAIEGLFAAPEEDPNEEFIRATSSRASESGLMARLTSLVSGSGLALPASHAEVMSKFLLLTEHMVSGGRGEILLLAPTWNTTGW